MAVTIYNLKNQKLDSEKLRNINCFSSDNFGGFVGAESPISISNNTINLAACSMLAAGIFTDIDQTSHTFTDSNNLWYISFTLRQDGVDYFDSNTPTGFNENIVRFNQCYCSAFENKFVEYNYSPVLNFNSGDSPAALAYYEYNTETKTFTLTTDTYFHSDKVYYYLYDNSTFCFTTNHFGTDPTLGTPPTRSYTGKVIWIENDINNKSFIIPLCAKVDGQIITVAKTRDLNALENLLSNEAYHRLLKYVNETFVWSVAGNEPIGGHTKGDIDGLHIANKTISANVTTADPNPNVTIINPAFGLTGATQEVAGNGFVLINSNGVIMQSTTDTMIPVERGGTGAATKLLAKQNLGIKYGTTLPSTADYSEGDIFFKIVE